jgi:hypothetical protein
MASSFSDLSGASFRITGQGKTHLPQLMFHKQEAYYANYAHVA